MARGPRQLCRSGIYHLMVRGVNRTVIFADDRDRLQYLNILNRIKEDESVSVLAFCLMPNHVHLLGKDHNRQISKFMHRLNGSYSHYFNTRHQRVGHLFQNRYKSEAVEDDAYLATVLRYIHLNPVKAGLSDQPEAYFWSSCKAYYEGADLLPGLTNTSFILQLYSDDLQTARAIIQYATSIDNPDYCWDIDEEKMTDNQAMKAILLLMQEQCVDRLSNLPRTERNAALRQIKEIKGLSIRQISRLTGVAFNIVKRA